MIKKILMIFITLTIFSCGNNNKEKDFVISTWTGAGNNFEEEKWIKKINFYDHYLHLNKSKTTQEQNSCIAFL